MDRIKADKNQAVRHIESISKFLIVAAAIAICYGAFILVRSGIELFELIKENPGREYFGECITELAEGLVLVVHYSLVIKFLFIELKKGQVFNREGAKELRVIGYETLILPAVVILISIVAFGGTRPLIDLVSVEIFELVLGIFIIQTGYVVDYATTKIERGHFFHEVYRYVREHDPELLEKAKNEIRGEKWLEENSVTEETENS